MLDKKIQQLDILDSLSGNEVMPLYLPGGGLFQASLNDFRKFIVQRGTSAQFVKGDGSLDNNLYIPNINGKAANLIIESGSDKKLILNNTDNEEKYQQIVFKQKGSTYGELGTYGTCEIAWNGSKIWHADNDGAKSKLDADLLDGVELNQIVENIVYDYREGCLVKLNAKANSPAMINVRITGNSYSSSASTPIDTLIQFYNYPTENKILSAKGIHNGCDFGDINIFNMDNFIYLWFKQIYNWESFIVKAWHTNASYSLKYIETTITNEAMPEENVERLVILHPKVSMLTDDIIKNSNTLNIKQLTNEDLNDLTIDAGYVLFYAAGSNTCKNIPISNTGFYLQVHPSFANSYTLQILTTVSGAIYRRVQNSNNWFSWQQLATTNSAVTKLAFKQLTNEDLNTLKDIDLTLYGGSDIRNHANCPEGVSYGFNLQVFGVGILIKQILHIYGNNKIYIRTCANNNWYTWIRILDSRDLENINNKIAELEEKIKMLTGNDNALEMA